MLPQTDQNATFIVDTKDAITQFWTSDFLRNPERLINRYGAAKTNGWSIENLSFINPGQEQDWSEDRDNPIKLANQFLEEGRAAKDPYKLSLAEANFQHAGRPRDEQEVRALRFEVEGDFVGAAKEHLALHNDQQALRLFWKARAYEEIYKNTTFSRTIEHRAAAFKVMHKSPASSINFLDFLFDEISGPANGRILADKLWLDIGNELIVALAAVPDEKINWNNIYSKLEQIRSAGLLLDNTYALAEIAFRANKYVEAIAIWDHDPDSAAKSDGYKKAKAETTAYPEQLVWLSRLDQHERLIRVYRDNIGNCSELSACGAGL